jgi:hypothetical protein
MDHSRPGVKTGIGVAMRPRGAELFFRVVITAGSDANRGVRSFFYRNLCSLYGIFTSMGCDNKRPDPVVLRNDKP